MSIKTQVDTQELGLYEPSKMLLANEASLFCRADPHDKNDEASPDVLWLQSSSEAEINEVIYFLVFPLGDDLWSVNMIHVNNLSQHHGEISEKTTVWQTKGTKQQVVETVVKYLSVRPKQLSRWENNLARLHPWIDEALALIFGTVPTRFSLPHQDPDDVRDGGASKAVKIVVIYFIILGVAGLIQLLFK